MLQFVLNLFSLSSLGDNSIYVYPVLSAFTILGFAMFYDVTIKIIVNAFKK